MVNVSFLQNSNLKFTYFLHTTFDSNNYSYDYHLPCRSINLLEFMIFATYTPLIGNPKKLSIPVTSQEGTSSSLNQDPSSRRHFPLPLIPTPSIMPVHIYIKELNPYHSNWSIKGYVQIKTPLHQFQNQYVPGKVFGFDLFDAEGGEIHITCFNNIANYFYDKFQVGNVYIV